MVCVCADSGSPLVRDRQLLGDVRLKDGYCTATWRFIDLIGDDRQLTRTDNARPIHNLLLLASRPTFWIPVCTGTML